MGQKKDRGIVYKFNITNEMRLPLKSKAVSVDVVHRELHQPFEESPDNRRKIIIVGGGPAGIMAAWNLADSFDVMLFEKSARLGRKFLLAGKGGLNITNSADAADLKKVYSPEGVMDKVLDHFDQKAFREWLMQLGIQTYEGTSGKVFPEKGMDVTTVLKKITDSLLDRGVTIYLNHRLTGFTGKKQKVSDGEMRFTFDIHESGLEEHREVQYVADIAVLALGGASWPLTGSDGKWVEIFNHNGISTLPFQPSNCGVNLDWPTAVKQFHAGKPLKNLVITVETADKYADTLLEESTVPGDGSLSHHHNISESHHTHTASKGEALITEYGLKGTAIYPLIPEVRLLLAKKLNPFLSIDFKPKNTTEQLLKKIIGKKTSTFGKVLALDTAQMAVIKAFTGKEEFMDAYRFCSAIKKLILPVKSLRPVEEAISVVGGIDHTDLVDDFSLRRFPHIYTIGEMINWDAPTGGYLLQGCFSMGKYVADKIKSKPHF